MSIFCGWKDSPLHFKQLPIISQVQKFIATKLIQEWLNVQDLSIIVKRQLPQLIAITSLFSKAFSVSFLKGLQRKMQIFCKVYQKGMMKTDFCLEFTITQKNSSFFRAESSWEQVKLSKKCFCSWITTKYWAISLKITKKMWDTYTIKT